MTLESLSTNVSFGGNQSTPFSVRCMLYYFIRTELSSQEPCNIASGYDKLRADASDLKRRKKTKPEAQRLRAAAEEGGPPVRADMLVGEWFDLAVALSQQFV